MRVETRRIAPIASGPFGNGGEVSGFTEHGWESVRDAFETNFALNMELGAQLVIYRDGDVVVDLHGKSSKQKRYTPRTLQNIYSSGKNMEAIVMAILVDRKRITYDDYVTMHWPEFGQGNKGDITIADVLRHEAGVPFFSDPNDLLNRWKDTKLTCQCLDEIEPMEKAIERAGKWHVLGRRHYHACTRGWILSGIVRRVDEQHRTLAQFMRDEICIPLGLNIHCGIPPAQQEQMEFADVTNMPLFGAGTALKAVVGGMGDKLRRGLRLHRHRSESGRSGAASAAAGSKMTGSADREIYAHSELDATAAPPPCLASSEGRRVSRPHLHVRGTGEPSTIRGVVKTFASPRSPLLRHNVAEWLIKDTSWANSVAGRAQEFPSVNMHADARSIALVNTLFCSGGVVGDVRLLSPETVALSFSEPVIARDEFLNATYSFSKGGFSRLEDMQTIVVPPDFRQIYDGFWGWGGLGGSWSLWDPHRRVSFAYMMNAKTFQNLGGPRGDRIMRAVQEVLMQEEVPFSPL